MMGGRCEWVSPSITPRLSAMVPMFGLSDECGTVPAFNPAHGSGVFP